MAIFTCSECDYAKQVDDSNIGKRGTCPKCKAKGFVRAMQTSPPIEKPKVAFQLPIETTQPMSMPTAKQSSFTACLIMVLGFCAVFFFCCLGSVTRPKFNSQGYTPSSSVTAHDALQVLADEVDDNLKANIFGPVSGKGRHAIVTLNSEYFTRLDDEARRVVLNQMRTQWVTRCFGSTITFQTATGSVVAEY